MSGIITLNNRLEVGTPRQAHILSMLAAGRNAIERECDKEGIRHPAAEAATLALREATIIYAIPSCAIERLDDESDLKDPKRVVTLMHCAMIGVGVDLSVWYGPNTEGHPAYKATQEAWTEAADLFNVESAVY